MVRNASPGYGIAELADPYLQEPFPRTKFATTWDAGISSVSQFCNGCNPKVFGGSNDCDSVVRISLEGA